MKNLVYINVLVGVFTLGLVSCSSSETGDSSENEGVEANESMKLFSNLADTSQIVSGALPYTIDFEEQTYPGKAPLPKLQSYASAMNQTGEILVVGGRRQGLHTFNPSPANNFVRDSANHFIFVVDPTTGDQWSFDVNQLSDDFSAPLQASNLQSYHDESTDFMYVVGGYGWKADGSNMTTFGTVIQFKVEDLSTAIKSGANAAAIGGLMKIGKDNRLAITGGALTKIGENFHLIFGQWFDGQYRAFGGDDFKQKYSNEIRTFRLNPQNLAITVYGSVQNSGADQPFHRRDGNIIESVDPNSAQPIMAALGGVFKPGIIGGYDYPIFFSDPSDVTLDSAIHQRFSQYECPVIPIYSSSNQDTSVYHNMFGGIGMYYYYQTPKQKAAFDAVTKQGRNDGLPFVADISVFQRKANGQFQEYILTNPIPGNRLLGSSTNFIPNRDSANQGFSFSNGVVNLNNFADGQKILVGYIYGGIEAEEPLPLEPNKGTFVSNSLFAVYVTKTGSGALPAVLATKARSGPPLTRLPRSVEE